MPMKKYWILIPILIATACHFPVLLCSFTWDDVTLVQTNSGLAQTDILPLFSQDYGLQLGPRTPVGYYRPAFTAMLALLYKAGGPSPFLFHSFSLLVFLTAVSVFALVCRSLLPGKSPAAAAIAASLYAAHAARTEMVALVMSLPDLLVELSCLLILLLILRYNPKTNSSKKALSGMFVFILLISLLASTAKESAFFILTAMSACLVLHYLIRMRSTYHLTAAAGMITALCAALLLNHQAQILRPPFSEYLRALFSSGSAGSLQILLAMFRDFIVPGPPVFMESVEAASSTLTTSGVVLITVIMMAGIITACRRSPSAALLFGWFAGQTGSLMLIGAVGIPYSQRYIPLSPFIIGTALLLLNTPKVTSHRMFALFCSLYIAIHAAFTLGGSIKCKDNLTFFTFMADEHPGMVYPRLYLADRLFFEYKNYSLMELHALKGITIAPDSRESASLRKLMARKRITEGSFSSALEFLEAAEKTAPGDDAERLWLTAICYLNLEKKAEALDLLEKAVSLDPGNAEYINTLKQLRP